MEGDRGREVYGSWKKRRREGGGGGGEGIGRHFVTLCNILKWESEEMRELLWKARKRNKQPFIGVAITKLST